jgi:serine/threonine-protein kinase
MADTLGGLHAAHELADASGVGLGVVHRDVSPQNILVSTRGVAKLIDFGIAKARERTAADTSTGTIKGKLHFMAPEQACGGTIDGRTDVFSIGAILYYLLTNRYAYHADSQAGTVLKLASGVPPDPLPNTIAPQVATIVLRALAYNQSIRFPSAAAMQEAIEDAMVKTGYATTTSAVASFMQEHLSHRAAARKKAIEQASEALANGTPIDIGPPSVMLAVAADSSPSESGLKNRTKMGLGVAPTMDMTIPVSHSVPPPPPSSEPGPPPSLDPLHTDPGSPTMGAATIPSPPPPAPARKSGRLFAVGFVTLAVLGIGVGGAVTLRNRLAPQAGRPEATGADTAAAAVTAPPSTTPELEPPVPSAPSGEPSAESLPVPAETPGAAASGSGSAGWAVRPRGIGIRAPVTAPSASGPKKRRKVDDGF